MRFATCPGPVSAAERERRWVTLRGDALFPSATVADQAVLMCGIAGVVSLEPDPALGALAASMRDALVHRGPDGEGLFVCESGRAAFGFRRLAVIDLISGAQPMRTPDERHAIAFNGEIYNFADLRTRLAVQHEFRTHSDTEVLLAGCAQQGVPFLRELQGMFAFALWDAREQRLLLARDRFGKKPLFWARRGARLYFASEMKALLRVLPAPEIDRSALLQYLALGYPAGLRTPYLDIERLAPGGTLEFDQQGLRRARYWELPAPDDRGRDDEPALRDWDARIAPLLEDSVRSRLISDVPLGAFLSGGLDSSTVVALSMQHAARPFHTFSVRAVGGSDDDANAAQQVAKLLGTTHHELTLSCPTPDEARRTLLHVDEPFGDSSIFPTSAVSALAREHVTVALSGDGGDELFGGYPVYRLFARVDRLMRLPLIEPAARLAARLWPARLRGRNFALRLTSGDGPRYLELIAHHWGAALARLAGSSLAHARRDALASLQELFTPPAAVEHAGPIARAQWLDCARGYLPGDILSKVDLASMSRSLEVRSPLLDHRLAEALATLPAGLRMRGGRGKILLRQIARRWLPDSIIERPKMGFSVPIEAWLRGPLRPLVEETLVDRASPLARLLDPDALRPLAAPPRDGEDARLQFTLLSLGVWASR